jgi:hypothetical protein
VGFRDVVKDLRLLILEGREDKYVSGGIKAHGAAKGPSTIGGAAVSVEN